MPHVLVAGTTGSGKSGCVNAILSSILMQASPNEVRFVLVDPKQVELNHYEHVPHLLTPVVTSPRLAANVLANLIGEMESRYGIMSKARCRNLDELNRARAKAGEAPLPHILCVIDELADLMMVSPAEVEDSIIRLAQKSRATGIHLVLATQRPSTDIITGTIKVNIPARIAFAVSSQTDSRVILDQGGAEALLGQGDMLLRGAGTSKLARIQGAFITEDEIARITKHWAKQGEPEFEEQLLETREVVEEGVEAGGDFDPDTDDLLDEAIRIVVETETASVSMIQRRLRVGYTRAGRLIDMLERRGVISGYEGSKPRQVLITAADLSRVIGGGEPEPVAAEIDGESLTRRTMAGWTLDLEPPCARREIAANSTFRRSRRRSRSGSATCGRWRTTSGRRFPVKPTRAASSAPTRPTSGSTASGSRLSSEPSSRLPATTGRGSTRLRSAAPAAAGGRLSRGALTAIVCLALAAAVVAIGLSGGDDGGGVTTSYSAGRRGPRRQGGSRPRRAPPTAAGRASSSASRPRPKSGSACSTPAAGPWSRARSCPAGRGRDRSTPVASRSPSATGRSRCESTERKPTYRRRRARSATRSASSGEPDPAWRSGEAHLPMSGAAAPCGRGSWSPAPRC